MNIRAWQNKSWQPMSALQMFLKLSWFMKCQTLRTKEPPAPFLTSQGPWHQPLAARLWVVPQSPSPAARSRAFRCSSRPRRLVHTRSSTSTIRFKATPEREDGREEACLALLTTELEGVGGMGPCTPCTLQGSGQCPGPPPPTAGLGTSCSSGIRGFQGLGGGCPAPLPPSHGDRGHVRPGRCSGFSI